MLPAIQLGDAPAFLAASGWRLLAVAADGSMWLWDLQAPAVILRASAAPLLALLPAQGACPTCIRVKTVSRVGYVVCQTASQF